MKKEAQEAYILSFQEGGRARESATQKFMQENMGMLHSMRQKFRLSEEEAIDVFTDAIMALILQVEQGKFKGQSLLSTYFYRIFYFKCVDHLQKKKTNIIEIDPLMEGQEIKDSSDIERWMHRLEAERLEKWMTKLGDTCKAILWDWGFWGYSMKEIAQRVGYDTGDQVKKRKYKCLQQLRKLMSDH